MRPSRFVLTSLAAMLLAGAPALAQEDVAVEETYEPVLATDWDGRTLGLRFSLAERVEALSSLPVDRSGTSFAPDASLSTQLRIGAFVDTGLTLAPVRIALEYEHDLYTGTHTGGLDAPDDFGVAYPTTDGTDTQLRELYAQLDVTEYLHLFGGFQLSHWGLGLVANDGDHGWAPGNAQFNDPRRGDRVLRGLLAVGPFTDLDLLVAGGYDVVEGDDVLIDGDEASQAVASATLGYGGPARVGVYGVVRRQEAADGAFLDVQAVDVAGAYELALDDGPTLTFEGEAVFIWGETSLAPTADHPVHDVRQLGAAARFTADFGALGAVLDVLYATGDANVDDDVVSNFKADPNFSMGLLLFPVVMAAQSSRAPVTASDPELIGLPSEDLDRLPSRGSATNTLAFFPKAFWHPLEGLEVYGGPLFALSEVPLADPFNTRLAGGGARNALDGESGGYLGTELDLGVRYRRIFAGTELTAGLEGAVFFPGSAFATADGGTMETVTGARALVRYRF